MRVSLITRRTKGEELRYGNNASLCYNTGNMMNAKRLIPLTLLALTALSACGGNEQSKPVKMRFGSLIGNRDDDLIEGTSQMKFIKKSVLTRLVQDKENFLLLLHGSEDTCSCFTTWHDTVFAPYVKRHKLLVYAITLSEFETDTEYYGLKRVMGYDTLAVFKDGAMAHQACTDQQNAPFVQEPNYFSSWMKQRVEDPEIFYVNEEILDEYYAGNESFTVYFGRDTCGDCSYLNRTALRAYLDRVDIAEPNFFYIDFDVYRPSRDDPEREAKMVAYQEKKDKYGLSVSEDNPAGYGEGAFPSVYYVQPDGASYTGDVIEASGVFYNETIKDGKALDSYFTKKRYDSEEPYLGYLRESNLATKWLDDLTFAQEGDRHDLLAPYEEPIFNVLLDYAVGPTAI